MKKSRYTEQQIVYALQHAEHDTPVKEVIRKVGISEQTFPPADGLEEKVYWASSPRPALVTSITRQLADELTRKDYCESINRFAESKKDG